MKIAEAFPIPEKVEEVARAMWDVRRANANNAGIFLEFWGDGTVPICNGILEEARVAIKAMEEPTNLMLDVVHLPSLQGDVDGQIIRTWRVMVLAALEPDPPK